MMHAVSLRTLKQHSLRLHKILGSVLALPLLLTTVTGMLFTYFHDYTHQKALAKACLKWHTLEVWHLEGIYPMILGVSVLSVLASAAVLAWRRTPSK
jgi:hypothetical protein